MKPTLMTLSAALALAAGSAAFVPAEAQRGPSRGDAIYVAKAGAGDMYEIQSSQMAADRARRADVREFARMLVADHRRSTEQVVAAARAEGMSPPPPRLEPHQRSMLRQLERSRGAMFDRLYLSQQIPAHQQALSLHRGQARRDRGPLGRTAAGIVTVVQGHLAHARRLSRMR